MSRIGRFIVSISMLFAGASMVGAQVPCAGDCDGDGAVTVSELIRGVNIALGNAPIGQCPAFDVDGSTEVEISELIQAVNRALNGCPASPTPEVTATETPLPPTFTPTAPIPTDTPTVEPTPTPSEPTPTPEEATATPTEPVPTDTPTEVPPTDTPAATETPQATVTATAEITITAEATATPTEAAPTDTPTPPAATETPEATSTAAPEATATSTTPPTETPMSGPTATATSEPGAQEAGEAVAGRVALLSNSVSGLNSMISGIVVAATGGVELVTVGDGGGAGDVGDPCPISGTTTQICEENGLNVTFTLIASNCEAAGPQGGTAVFDGIMTLMGTSIAGCSLPPLSGSFTVDLTAILQSAGNPTLDVVADVDGTYNLTPAVTECLVSSVSLTLSGTLSSTLSDFSGTAVTFDNTSVVVNEIGYNEDCVPIMYTMTFDGGASITELFSDESFDVVFDQFEIRQDASGSPVLVTYDGTLQGQCLGLGAEVTLQTLTPVAVVSGELCPNDGVLDVTSPLGDAQVSYSQSGVELDTNGDGTPDETFASCTDPELLMCPEI